MYTMHQEVCRNWGKRPFWVVPPCFLRWNSRNFQLIGRPIKQYLISEQDAIRGNTVELNYTAHNNPKTEAKQNTADC
jgi:hypothetical protein